MVIKEPTKIKGTFNIDTLTTLLVDELIDNVFIYGSRPELYTSHDTNYSETNLELHNVEKDDLDALIRDFLVNKVDKFKEK